MNKPQNRSSQDFVYATAVAFVFTFIKYVTKLLPPLLDTPGKPHGSTSSTTAES